MKLAALYSVTTKYGHICVRNGPILGIVCTVRYEYFS